MSWKNTKSKIKSHVKQSDGAPNFSQLKNKLQYLTTRYDFALLFFLFFIVYNTVSGIGLSSGDVLPASVLPLSLILYQNPYFDTMGQFLSSNPNYAYAFPFVNGHYVSLFPIVTPVLITPIYWISITLSNIFSIPIGDMEFFILAKCSASIIAALAGVLVYLTGKELFSKKVALTTAFIFAFATSTWAISSQALWQHGTVELLLISMIYLIIKNEKAEWRGNIFLLGILSGLFIFNRPPDLILLIPVIFYIIWTQRKTLHYYVFGSILSGLPFFYYNYSIFGNFFGGTMVSLSLFAINLNFISNFIGLLIAPNVGLFIFCPILILSIVGFIKLRDIQKSKINNILILFGPVIALQILLYSFYRPWAASAAYCYGPRFLTGFVPVLCLFIGFFLNDYFNNTQNKQTVLKKWGVPLIIGILIASSVLIQFIGVFFFNQYPEQTTNDKRAWDWNDSIIVGSYISGIKNIQGISVYTLPPLPPLFVYQLHPEVFRK